MASSFESVAILGARGQLGTELVDAARRAGVKVHAFAREDLDVTDVAALKAHFEQARPSVVVNTAALHQVDACQDDPLGAFRVNAAGAALVAHAARAVGARTVYVSTDYVFDGGKPPARDGRTTPQTAYSEEDATAPLNVYGASKVAGEHATRVADPDALVVRIASVFGAAGSRGKGGNFIETMLRKARAGETLTVVDDQHMTPTYARDAADAILALAQAGAAGVVHAANGGACTWFDLAAYAVRKAGLDVEVRPVSASAFPSKARRPANSALHPARLQALVGRTPRPWQEAVDAYLVEKGHVGAGR